jgi:hypothetical protein
MSTTARGSIAELFGYRSWAASFLPQLAQQAEQIVRRDVMPGFVAAELIVWLSEHKIIRPGHTTLQELVSEALSTERRRLGGLLAEVLDESATARWASSWCVTTPCLNWQRSSRTLKISAGVRWQGAREARHAEVLARIAKALLPKLGISQQNLLYYASLANFYTVHDLRHLKAEQTRLYLLCYAWVRYRQLTDNLVDAMAFHMKNLRTRAARVRNSPLSPNSCDAIRKRRRLAACCRCTWTTAWPIRRRSARCANAPTKSCPGNCCKTRRSA